ncbi:copper amine oxidase N-terminal domain-containing protein [Cytobacillus dafuensis]|uniref:Copper amine oxidase N-terminal domain-containing protein n=1 Tax=Cytobacillus dafuensis TaxID=1742359 RepID=A0A5B8ZC50_CYTDA|nr:copper amine oxidase N-terminal domain-containing protein [Cytobacillus dafuensis]QED49279.1 copper amine oxidase N-terminal domain-containing protein [Cytobacillus dafuensis]
MKRIGILATAVLVSGLALSNHSGYAANKPADTKGTSTVESAQQIETSKFIKFSGVIQNIEKDKKSSRLLVENQNESLEMVFPITDEVLLFDNGKGEKLKKDKLEKGMKVEAYYDKNKPMPLIYPATITPEVMIVNGKEMGQVKISKYDKNLISLDNEIKLNISKDTILLNEKGETIKKADLTGKELIVFYNISTRSIPAQTTPVKIIALEYTDEKLVEMQKIIDEDHYFKDETKMIPIRKVAEHLGYNVKWNNKQKNFSVSKQNRSFLISIGKKEYGYNRSIKYFDVAPEIKNGKSYVPEEFLDMLLMK